MEIVRAALHKRPAPVPPLEFDAVGLLCLLGIVISLAVIPHINVETLGAVLAQLE